jgi:hypothetical protein
MTLLAPWVLGIGALLGVAAMLAHLIARDVPPRWLLPTARFIPASRTDVLTRSLRPRDPWLLLVRLGILAALIVAAADPAARWRSRARASVVIADLSRSTGDRTGVVRAVRERVQMGDIIVRLDTIARVTEAAALDAAPLSSAASPGRLSAALLVAFDAAHVLERSADSVEIVLISSLVAEQFDAATDSIRAQWPGPITVVPVPGVPASQPAGALVIRAPTDDPLRVVLASITSDSTVRLVRDALTADDSAHARRGGTVVLWPFRGTVGDTAYAISVGHETAIAPFGRRAAGVGRTVAWWADGSAAATEQPLGRGCVRIVGMVAPTGGDLLLTARVRRVVAALIAPCGVTLHDAPAADRAAQRIARPPRGARTLQQADAVDLRLIRAALALALLLLLLEWRMRRPLHR